MKITTFFGKKQFVSTFVSAIVLGKSAVGGSLGKEEALGITGTSEFEAPTNMPAVSVNGKSSAVHGRVQVSRDADRLMLGHLEAAMPVKSLVTGMAVRDEHMRKHVFTTEDGQTPDLHFEAGESVVLRPGFGIHVSDFGKFDHPRHCPAVHDQPESPADGRSIGIQSQRRVRRQTERLRNSPAHTIRGQGFKRSKIALRVHGKQSQAEISGGNR